jgi:hypothetical protein
MTSTLEQGILVISNIASVRVISKNLEMPTLRQHLVLVGSVLPIFLVPMTRLKAHFFIDYIIVLPFVFTNDIELSFIERSCALNKKMCL